MSTGAWAQQGLTRDQFQTPPVLGLTVSGGVSLGAFEAGYLYYLFETLKVNPGLVEPRIFTGASAGSVNALLSLMASCSPSQRKPEDSLFYQTWVPIGLNDLFDPKETTPTGLFTRKPLLQSVEGVKAYWEKEGLPESCDATLGVATTRVTAARVDLVKDRVTLPRTEAKFVFRVRGQGKGKPPLLTNYVTRDNPLLRPLLPTLPNGNIAFDSLVNVLLASASFPLAFQPMPILHCPTSGIPGVGPDAETPPPCTPDKAQTLLFIDGGVFDNQPLRLAVQLAQRGLIQQGGTNRWRPVPDLDNDAPPAASLFVYVDPDVEVLPNLESTETAPDDATIPYISHILGQLVNSGRTKELQALLEDQMSVREHIGATRSYFMPLSQPLRNFFGFFEKDIRIHDFYLGMHSAHRYFDESVRPWAKLPELQWPEDAYGRQPELKQSWQALRCMQFAFDGVGDPHACEGLDPNLRAGIQTTLDRLYARCDRLARDLTRVGKPIPATTHEHCRHAFQQQSPPVLAGLGKDRDWRFEVEESVMNHQLRRLAANGFVFKDLGVPPNRSKTAKRQVAIKIREMVSAISENQADVGGTIIPLAGRLGAQALDYSPPESTLHFTLGRFLEMQYSRAPSDPSSSWIRGTMGLAIDGILSLVGPATGRYFAITPLLGGEAELGPLSTYAIQTRLGVRGGFVFSSIDSFATVGCDETGPCSRAFFDTYLALTFYQLIRVQLGVVVAPPMRGLPWTFGLTPQLGVEFDRP